MPSSVGIVASGVGNAAVGQSLLLGMVGFWDARLYSGSGAWLNLGTGGSTGNLAPQGDVIYTANKFAIGGTVIGYFDQGTANATYHLPTKGSGSFSAGIVQQTNAAIFRLMVSESLGTNWDLVQDTPTKRAFGEVVGGGSVAFNGPTSPSYTKDLRGFTLDDSTHLITPHLGVTMATAVADGRAGSSSLGRIVISSVPGSGTYLPQDVHGLYVHQGLLTPANIADICAYFGV